MISETTSALAPADVIREAAHFFTGPGSPLPATIIEQGDAHLTVSTFRSRIAVSAFPDPGGEGTRVRVSTLRRNDAVGKLLTLLSGSAPRPADDSPASA